MAEQSSGSDQERWRRYVSRLDAARGRLVDEVEADVAGYRGLTMEQRGRLVADLADMAWRIIQARPDREKVLALRDPMPADFEPIWNRLVERRRAARGG